MSELFSYRAKRPLTGEVSLPGDKSISHRALMFGALAVGETRIQGLLESEDVLNTAAALRAFGASIEKDGDNVWHVQGRGVGGFKNPDDVIDLGNSGTSARLLLGLAASQPLRAVFTGDASLRSRPMERVMGPLRQMGARFESRDGGRMPVSLIGPETALPLEYRLPVASAQVKSAILLAGLNAPGETTVIEPTATRDHTENFLQHFGAEVKVSLDEDGARRITVKGQSELHPAEVVVPADPSSAAFPMAAALLTPGSEITLTGVNLNPLRIGLITTLQEMGADIRFINERRLQGEPAADLLVRASHLKATCPPTERMPAMIDELPILAVIAAFAEGRTEIRGAEEMRVKESDRIDAMVTGLRQCGVEVEEFDDGMAITGGFTPVEGPVTINTRLDHRIAMSFIIMATVGGPVVHLEDGSVVNTSFPGFTGLMNQLGADIRI